MNQVKESIRKNFRHATLNFLFIILFVNVFQMIFGAENSIVGVIFTIMMSASMVRDMTATPWKHLFMQAAVLLWMGISACLVSAWNPLAALPVNLITIFIILYAFTYEYSNHMYFPYILSYLFLIFISPVSIAALPKRLLGLFVGAVSIILYQLFMGHNRVVETASDVLTAILDEAEQAVRVLLTGDGKFSDPGEVRSKLRRLSRTVYERRKKVLCVSDASFSMIDAGRGLEHMVLLLQDMKSELTPEHRELLNRTSGQLMKFRAYLQRESSSLPNLKKEDFILHEGDGLENNVYHALCYVQNSLLHMTDPEKRTQYRKTKLSLSVRLKAALDVSPVRVIYAVRVAVILAGFTLLVQEFALPHGKWLLFTLASLSLPYADDIGLKTRKRIMATMIGGLVSVAIFALVPSMAGRTAVMMLSGYVSFYFSDYTGTYACSTIGALGGAVIMQLFGFHDVGAMFLVRVAYICIGAIFAFALNCLFFPYKRGIATRQLLRKYVATSELLSRVCAEDDVDAQLYYSLVIQAHMQEDKLAENAEAEGFNKEIMDLLAKSQSRVRNAHRRHADTMWVSAV